MIVVTRAVMWFRDDLRLGDHPALAAATRNGVDGVLALYVVDETAWDRTNSPRRAYRRSSLKNLADAIGGIEIAYGDPAVEVRRVARDIDADSVHVQSDIDPHGRQRDDRVAAALAEDDIRFETTGSAYIVDPGDILKPDGTPYRVYSPFANAWSTRRAPSPPGVSATHWLPPRSSKFPDAEANTVSLPPAGEQAALSRWHAYANGALGDYELVRDNPGANATSRMSIPLAHGEIHPRTMWADLPPTDSAFRRELVFREFYADVLWHRPDTVEHYYNPAFADMEYDEPGDDLEAWKQGRTGMPIVDAGMRQLLAEGWMHNRVRMIVASFLVKDLHLEWQHGANHFLDRLTDADRASNQHGWQWVAGCGTDAAPYFRIFNPVLQGKKFDPDGDYVRRHVPELRDVPSSRIHEPWLLPDGPPGGYPLPLVDHAEERIESLARYDRIRR